MEVYNNMCKFGSHISTGCCSYIYTCIYIYYLSFQSCEVFRSKSLTSWRMRWRTCKKKLRKSRGLFPTFGTFLLNSGHPSQPYLSHSQFANLLPHFYHHSNLQQNSHLWANTLLSLRIHQVWGIVSTSLSTSSSPSCRYRCLPLNSLHTALPVPVSTRQAPSPGHVTQPPPLCQLPDFAENSLAILCIAFHPLLHCLIAIAYLLILYSCVSSSTFSYYLVCSAGSFSFMYKNTVTGTTNWSLITMYLINNANYYI